MLIIKSIKNFTVFVMGNNLLNKKYEHYLGYKVLGAQVLGGLGLLFKGNHYFCNLKSKFKIVK